MQGTKYLMYSIRKLGPDLVPGAACCSELSPWNARVGSLLPLSTTLAIPQLRTSKSYDHVHNSIVIPAIESSRTQQTWYFVVRKVTVALASSEQQDGIQRD